MGNKNENNWNVDSGNWNPDPNNNSKNTDPKVTISFLCGIAAILCEVIGFVIVGREYDPSETVNEFLVITNISKVIMSLSVPLSIAGIVFALSARKRSRLRKTGIVLNAAVLAAVTLLPIIAFAFVMIMWNMATGGM